MAWILQNYGTQEPMIHFAVMDQSLSDTGAKEHWDYPRYEHHWEFPQFSKVVIPYMVATNCEQVEVHVNEKTFLLQPAIRCSENMPMYSLLWKDLRTLLEWIMGYQGCGTTEL